MATLCDDPVNSDSMAALLSALLNLRQGARGGRLPVEWTGVAGKVADAFNEMAAFNERLADDLGRLSVNVGKHGRLAQRLAVGEVHGYWRESVESVNELIDDLVHPTSETARVIGAVAKGDLSQTMALQADGQPLQGEFLRTATTINRMVDQLGSFASEVTRVAREVGTEGKLGGQAQVEGVAGTWKDLTDSVNMMAGNLTGQVRNIAEVATAIAGGDLSKKIAVDVKGEFLELKNTINTMVDQLRSFASEVTRVAREVGTEGNLGGQARVEGVSGTWKDLTDNVNFMAGNLTAQVRNIDAVIGAVAKGDLSKKITVDVKGEILVLKNTINTMVDQLGAFASEVTRVAREVGTEGKLGGQADVPGVAGTWKDLTDSVNMMAGNLTGQVRNIAEVSAAIAGGDLSRKITVDVKGEILELKNTLNTMVDQLRSFAAEVTRVAREVGTEGKLGGQADVPGVAGTWKNLTDSVNMMAGNLTGQVRNIAEVATAIASGDLSKKITVDVKGEILELKNTVNTMVDQLGSFAAEVTRVAREVGTEGKLGGQADVKGVAGTWKDLTDSVNMMAGNLTGQVRNIAEVATAIATGDLSKKITVDVKGEILELKNTINTMVDQLRSFAAEVTRVAREVGTEGKLGGQADVPGVAGTWKDLTDNVNSMASNLTVQLREFSKVATAIATGDLTQTITVDVRGEILQIKDVINTMVDQLGSFASEVTRVAREVGTEGKLGGQADVKGVAGTWKSLTDSVNMMAGNLTGQVRNIAEVSAAIAGGDLSRKITVDVKGEILELKNTINPMVDQLRSFAAEVTRVAREVGTEGKLGGQADVQGVAGTWKDLTDSVNGMAGNLTAQVRGIAIVVTAVANGDLKRKLTVDAKGEIAELAGTINDMIDTLATFADQVTSVAREVGVEGQLGGQAKVPGAAGTWKALTENVNQLAANLTTQVRAIAEVATAVTKGDLTRSVTVEALGEVAALKDTINEMIRNLRDTTQKSTEQDWLKTNLAKFSRMLQGQRDLTNVGRMILSELSPVVAAQQAEFYVLKPESRGAELELLASFASEGQQSLGKRLGLGEGLVGQCALEKRKMVLTDVPPEYVRISSGLGAAAPKSVLVLPLVFEGQVRGVLELASLEGFNPTHQDFLDQLTESLGIVLNTIEANMRTEGLLQQSQSLAQQLQTRQQQLQTTNKELEEQARLLAEQNRAVELKNEEVEQARQELEDQAKQLALTSKYKSEFLANMSHELRTPLNSLLILSDQLSRNADGNLTDRQTEFAKTIHGAGNDLLNLINDILDLSRIESGTVLVDVSELRLDDFESYVDRTFRHVAEAKSLDFELHFDSRLPRSMHTDARRMQQIIKNLLANAFKFTQKGTVSLTVEPARIETKLGDSDATGILEGLAFSVSDTGIGIPSEAQQIVFEAFQQADGSTSRKYGGTGLGLAISRELARLLGGEIRLKSVPDRGSTFTLYLPVNLAPARTLRRPIGGDGAALPVGPSGGNVNPPAAAPAVAQVEPLPHTRLVNEHDDDRDDIAPGDPVLLVVENDRAFARVALETARKRGWKGLVTSQGAVALALVREYQPDAITLDLHLPDMQGWRVLDRLKNDVGTRHIPVCVISTDEARERALGSGAWAFLAKPLQDCTPLEKTLDALSEFLSREERLVLVVDADEGRRANIERQVNSDEVRAIGVASAAAAQGVLAEQAVDCIIAHADDGELPRLWAEEEPAQSGAQRRLPLIVFGDGAGTAESVPWSQLGSRCTLRMVQSSDRLVDSTAYFLHRNLADLPDEQRTAVLELHESDRPLAGRKTLIVDDDVRNIFALTAVLEEHEMEIVSADNGRDAVRILQEQRDIDVVLMDIMMPEMDGIETMREIRKLAQLDHVPIIAVTAKAMKGDRERCIEAGAWDYLSKPVETQQLLSTLRAWLHR
jgi:HAMP domain-containing protein/signal transduction histidine kinase/DNA-binding response OmpR family regulator